MMKIEINIIRQQYVMEISMGDYRSTHVARSINECLGIAKEVARDNNPRQKMVFRVINHGYDANGSPITELVTEACG